MADMTSLPGGVPNLGVGNYDVQLHSSYLLAYMRGNSDCRVIMNDIKNVGHPLSKNVAVYKMLGELATLCVEVLGEKI